jgi:hypothetical protein
MNNQINSELVFSISIEDLQYEAMERLSRELTEEEIDIAKKGLMWGLMTDIDSVYGAIFEDMIPNAHRKRPS